MSIHHIDLARADLNLLVVFEVLLQTRHVGRAAARLNLSQSALSHALARLRDWLGDPLFVRHPKGMSPTPRALDLAVPLARALAEVRAIVDVASPFEPASVRLTLRLGATDYAVAVLLAPLLSGLRGTAPGLDLRVRPVDRDAIPVLLDAGEVDLVLAHFPNQPRRFARTILLEERFVGLARRGHPLLRQPTLDALLAWPHALVSPRGDATGVFDEALSATGRSRRIAET
jgi:DNA-binding transcriptional LysR family regulator